MKNRDMFYQNVNQGYYNQGQFIPPSGYNMNTEYQSFGPNVVAPIPQNNMGYNPNDLNTNNYNNNNYNDLESRVNTLERQIRNLDTRIQRLESEAKGEENIYMI